MFKLNETFTSKQVSMYNVDVCKKFVSDKVTIELVEYKPTELAILWDTSTVAILSDRDVANVVFNHYCTQAMNLHPNNSCHIIDFEQ